MKRILNFKIIFGLIIIHSSFTALGQNENSNLLKFKWKNRLLVLRKSELPDFKRQTEIFNSSSRDNLDRQLLMISISDSKLIEKIGLSLDSFSMVLIGKDGLVKKTFYEVTDMASIYELIDSMPMRRNEN